MRSAELIVLALAAGIGGFVSGRIRFCERNHALNRSARGLRFVGDNGHLGSHQGVQQGGLAGIGAAQNGNEAGNKLAGRGRHGIQLLNLIQKRREEKKMEVQ